MLIIMTEEQITDIIVKLTETIENVTYLQNELGLLIGVLLGWIFYSEIR